ncbi:MAG: type II toxin-antitoxin system RelE/ParE family toxin [Gemmataceae bacterium]|nr:type II toxin-antitoxin system RelE/ParE family toxin [Gemmataceae bacterium]MCI0738561.1 type II toxin-antitoxin system RelE/ParE family toxin [Gemmataceae bacterium]
MSAKFHVIWRRVLIEKQLADLVVALKNQGKSMEPVTAAMTEIDRRLSQNPEESGESRPDFERILIVPPLVVDYEVHDEERVVFVLRLRYMPARSKSENGSD